MSADECEGCNLGLPLGCNEFLGLYHYEERPCGCDLNSRQAYFSRCTGNSAPHSEAIKTAHE